MIFFIFFLLILIPLPRTCWSWGGCRGWESWRQHSGGSTPRLVLRETTKKISAVSSLWNKKKISAVSSSWNKKRFSSIYGQSVHFIQYLKPPCNQPYFLCVYHHIYLSFNQPYNIYWNGFNLLKLIRPISIYSCWKGSIC